jgi:hypothetical protein
MQAPHQSRCPLSTQLNLHDAHPCDRHVPLLWQSAPASRPAAGTSEEHSGAMGAKCMQRKATFCPDLSQLLENLPRPKCGELELGELVVVAADHNLHSMPHLEMQHLLWDMLAPGLQM